MKQKSLKSKHIPQFLSNMPHVTRNAVLSIPMATPMMSTEGSSTFYPRHEKETITGPIFKASELDPQSSRVDFILRAWSAIALEGKTEAQFRAEEDAYRARIRSGSGVSRH